MRIKESRDEVLRLERYMNQRLRIGGLSTIIPLLFQTVVRLTFLTQSLTTRLIQKIYTNIVKFKLFLKILY